MSRIIEELWYSNICRSEQSDHNATKGQELFKLITTNREKLCDRLAEAKILQGQRQVHWDYTCPRYGGKI